MKMIINPDIAKVGADLSRIPAFSDGTLQNTVYWSQLCKEQVFTLWQYAMSLLGKYQPDTTGSLIACEILGVLEDMWPDYCEEFEEFS
jgi:hypothetical protein